MGKTGYSKAELNGRYYQGFADGVKEIEAKYREIEFCTKRRGFALFDIGKTVFLTKSEARAKLTERIER